MNRVLSAGHTFGLALLGACAASGCASGRAFSVSTVPVADVRREPGMAANAGTHDPFQETQVLYGERLRVLKTEDAWAAVEAVEQPEFTHHGRWQGYPGWVLKDLLIPLPSGRRPNAVVTAKWTAVWKDSQAITPQFQLPMGTRVVITSTEGLVWPLRLLNGHDGWISRGAVEFMTTLKRLTPASQRQAILHNAEQFLGDPYFWGGRSPFAGLPNRVGVTGVDCSGLVNLVYRAVGIDLPRDAHEQYLRARHIPVPKPADLIFLSAPDDPSMITHVMLYAGDDWVIEGPGTGLPIRRIELATRLGRPLSAIASGDVIDGRTVFFGAYLSD